MYKKNWWRLSFDVNYNFEDTLIWKLLDIGISSYSFHYSENNNHYGELVVWLPKSNWDKAKIKNLEEIFFELFKINNYKFNSFSYESVNANDWLNSWKKYWNPITVGKNFLILPSWLELPKKYEDRNIIKIDPGLAFGTGDHPSTSLCLEMMEDQSMFAKKILDIGCGSGILSIAAKKLGAGNISSIDNDYLSINSTKENIVLNFNNQNDFIIYQGTFNEIINNFSLHNFDYVICNILAEIIKEIIPYLPQIINTNGKIILSGIISTQKDDIIKLLNLYNFRVDHVVSKKDWICIQACLMESL